MRKYEDLVEPYTDYLIVVNGQAKATGLSGTLNNKISHDQFTCMLSCGEFGAIYLWKKVKKTVCQIESEDGYLIVDDAIVEKLWTDENEIVCWHYDHKKGRLIKGFDIINLVYHVNDISIPVGFEVGYTDRQLNFTFITKRGKHFIAAIKSNRLFVRSLEKKVKGRFKKVGELGLRDKESVRGYLRGYDKEVILLCHIFTNKDGSTGTLYLSDKEGNHTDKPFSYVNDCCI